METNIEGILVANTTQIINSTLNNNEMVKIARRTVQLITKKIVSARTSTTTSPCSDSVIA